MKKDTITVKIRCGSKKCEQLRNNGLFFQVIADALFIKRKDIKEIIKQGKI